MTLRPYQQEVIDQLAKLEGKSFVTDRTLGKTVLIVHSAELMKQISETGREVLTVMYEDLASFDNIVLDSFSIADEWAFANPPVFKGYERVKLFEEPTLGKHRNRPTQGVPKPRDLYRRGKK